MSTPKIENLLIIEDNLGDAILLKEYLKEIFVGVSVMTAQTFAEASEILSTEKLFDAIFLDLSLPDNSGKDLVNDVIALAWFIPVIVLTGYSDEKFGIETLSLGVSDYLVKDDLTLSQLSKSLTYSIERKRIERKLVHSNERYEILAKATSDTIWDWNIGKKKIVSNQGITRVFGYKEDEVQEVESWWREKIHPDDYRNLIKTLTSNFKKGIPIFQLEYRFKCADGKYKYVLDRGYLILDAKNKPARMIGAMQDITLKKEEEEKLRLLESVISNATDAIIIADADEFVNGGNEIIYVNEAFIKMTGYARSEVLGAGPKDFLGSELDEEELQKLDESLKSWQSCNLVLSNIKKDGKKYWANVSVTPVSDAKGGFTHWIFIQRDVSDRRSYLQSIEEQNKRLKEIAWMQSHIVRAPLARIMGLASLLTEQNIVSEIENVSIIDNISSSAVELDKIIRQIVEKTENVHNQTTE